MGVCAVWAFPAAEEPPENPESPPETGAAGRGAARGRPPGPHLEMPHLKVRGPFVSLRAPAKADARAPRARAAAQRKPWQPRAPGRAPPGASSTDRCYVVRQTGEAFKTYACVNRHRPPDPEPTTTPNTNLLAG